MHGKKDNQRSRKNGHNKTNEKKKKKGNSKFPIKFGKGNALKTFFAAKKIM